MTQTQKENPFLEFESLLDNACVKLQHKKAQYSIRRLQELDEILLCLEKELDALILEAPLPAR